MSDNTSKFIGSLLGSLLKYGAVLLVLWIYSGCTRTTIVKSADNSWQMQRSSFLQKVSVPSITVQSNGTVIVKGYDNDGGNEALKTSIEAAVTAAVKAMK